jgi:hypothetical protein
MTWHASRWFRIDGLVHGFGDRLESPPAGVVTLRQVHGRTVHDAAEAARRPGAEGDALLATRSGELVGVATADCVPLLLVAPSRRAAAAVHAGWRGCVLGVVDAAVDALRARADVSVGELEAAIGPGIGGCCYEVGPEVREAFARPYDDPAGFEASRRDGRFMLDLRRFVDSRLRTLGIPVVETIGPCTACRTDLLFSYRREGKTGRQLSWVGWR